MAANLSNLKQISSDILSYKIGTLSVSSLLQNFFSNPSTTAYGDLKTGLIAARAAVYPTVRVLVG